MAFNNGPYMWFDGQFVRWEEATVMLLLMRCTMAQVFSKVFAPMKP